MTSQPTANAVASLRATVAKLRAPGGCPWDREQTHQTLRRHLVEEVSELLEALDNGDLELMREELGDVLLQVVLHAQIAEESGVFNLEDVAGDIDAKLIRRHPHVFGEIDLETSDEVLTQWEQIKAQEKASRGEAPSASAFKDLPPRLPALLFARDSLKQAAKLDATSTADLVNDEADQPGGRLLAVVQECLAAGVDPEAALRETTDRLRASIDAAVTESPATVS